MFTPNLYCCASILWTMRWLDCADLDVFVVPIISGVSYILERTVQRDRKSYILGFLFCKLWTVFALDTKLTTFELGTFPSKMFVDSGCAWNVSSANSNIAELAFWLWMFLLELGEGSTVHEDLRVARARTLLWCNTLDLDSWLSALKEFLFSDLIC